MSTKNLQMPNSDSPAGSTKPIVSSSEFETMERWCPNCKRITQYVKLYNPDNAEDGEVWECHYCEENTGWAS